MLGQKSRREVFIMNDGLLLQSVEGLSGSPFVATGGGIWQLLQGEKEGVCRELLSEGPLCHSEVGALRERESSETNGQEIEWRHRGQLEGRLRDINDAQDRLMNGAYGFCVDCGAEIRTKRLLADPAVALCIDCQRTADGDIRVRTL